MKRKVVSFILCIAMCMALAIPAFAVELSPYATDEVGNFSQMIEFAFSDNVEGRFRYSYNDAAGNVVDGIVIKEISTDGTTKLNFVEGDKSDKVEIDSIRDVILNGNCIKVTTQESSKLSTEYDIAPFAHTLSIIIKRTETQLSRLCVFSLLQPHRTEVRLTGKYRYLTFEDRKKIEAWHLLGDRPVDIAARLSVHHTTIYKELQRGATGALDANQREGYSAELAERRLRESFKRRGKRAPAAQ